MSPRPSKVAFVTVGATAPFDDLIAASLSSTVIATLSALGYTDLRIQFGTGRQAFEQRLSTTIGSRHSVSVSGFDFAESIREEIAAADLVISHAGSGSILDALRYQKILIVVPNESLMDNHQKELSEELERQGYLIEGHVEDLQNAIYKAEKAEFTHFPENGSKKFIKLVDEEMGMLSLD
ncbi:glycosyl transferase [Morchella snyderi]|nr:glycosyl transferase [Morchella snyderi]